MLMVEFASGQFTGLESSGFIEVIVRVTGGVSSSPITVTVTPSEQSPVSAMGKLCICYNEGIYMSIQCCSKAMSHSRATYT